MDVCKKCGGALAEDSVFCPSCGERLHKAHRCASCHAELPEHSRFCYRCGRKVSVSIFVKGDGGRTPKIWTWQPDGRECSKDMGFAWESRPHMQTATEMEGWYRFDIDADCYEDTAAFSFIIDDAPPVHTDMTDSFCYDGTRWWGI